MKRKAKSPKPVDLGLVPRASAPITQVQKARRCPVCGRPANTEVAIGPVTVFACERCSALPYHLMGLADIARRLL